ncbi:MAG: hypothetical protein LUI02_06065 [Clostridiales bacterium]|nr:hypothetical protein [Clostridiales bacterium]
MKTLYLHIGTPKTATTSIQEFCAKNRKLLRQQGIRFPLLPFAYPRLGRGRNAHFLSSSVTSEVTDESKEALWQDRLEIGLSMIADSFSSSDKVLLSDETLWRAVNYSRHDPIQILRDHAEKNGYAVKFIVYLRRQDKFLVSRWNQQIKKSGQSFSFSEYMEMMSSKYPLVCDYAATLDMLADKFGKDSLIVRQFEPATWVDGSIYADFLDVFGLKLTDDFFIPEAKRNSGLEGNYLEIRRIINSVPDLSFTDRYFLYLCLTQASNAGDGHCPYGVLSAEETRKILDKYREGNDKIAREYIGIDGPLFSEEISELPKYDPANPYMTEDLIRALTVIVSRLLRRNSNLRTAIRKQRGEIKELKGAVAKQGSEIAQQREDFTKEIGRLRTRLDQFIDKVHHPMRAVLGRGRAAKN